MRVGSLEQGRGLVTQITFVVDTLHKECQGSGLRDSEEEEDIVIGCLNSTRLLWAIRCAYV